MPMTKEQAMAAQYHDELHYGECTRIIGPRGDVKENIMRVRVSGRCQTWVTRPDEFRLPFKEGFYDHGAITGVNAYMFHLAKQCPLIEHTPHTDTI